VSGEEGDHLTTYLQIGDVGVEQQAVDAVDLQTDLTVEHVVDVHNLVMRDHDGRPSSPRCTSAIGQSKFKKFLERIEPEVPEDLDIHLILDNYATHKTPAIKAWLLRHPRFHLHFVPTGSSWLNLVEPVVRGADHQEDQTWGAPLGPELSSDLVAIQRLRVQYWRRGRI